MGDGQLRLERAAMAFVGRSPHRMDVPEGRPVWWVEACPVAAMVASCTAKGRGWVMAVRAMSRGHVVLCDESGWRYKDTGEEFNGAYEEDRPCAHCGLPPHEDGRDGCLPTFNGGTSVCCGHGGRQPVIVVTQLMLPTPTGARP